jgi:hypothetical protein
MKMDLVLIESVGKDQAKLSSVEYLDVEEFAKALHEAGRAAVEAGNTVAAEKFGEKTRTFIEWDDLTETAREGRRIQARWFKERFIVLRRVE